MTKDKEEDIFYLPIGDPVEGKSIPIHVCPEEELEEMGEDLITICGYPQSPPLFPDNVHTVCAGCGCEVVHRPYIPERSTKVCLACGLGMADKQ